MKLSQRTVDALKPGERKTIWDDALKGFGVALSENKISYVVDFRLGSRRRRVVLGSTQVKTFAEARDEARDILAQARKGVDASENPRAGMPTFGDVWNKMLDEVDRPKLSPATIKDYEDRAKRLILPKIGKKLIGDIAPADVDKIVAAITGERNRAYAVVLIKKTINHAIRARILPVAHRNPAADMKVKRSRKAGRALEIEEIQAFGKALADMEREGQDRRAGNPSDRRGRRHTDRYAARAGLRIRFRWPALRRADRRRS